VIHVRAVLLEGNAEVMRANYEYKIQLHTYRVLSLMFQGKRREKQKREKEKRRKEVDV
jgi:hypothetical protein